MKMANGLSSVGKSRLVLIVEDEVDVRRSAVEAMLAMGYRTIEAENASEALDLLEQKIGRAHV